MEPRHHRSDGHPDHLGDLFIGEALDVEEDRGPELLGKGRERLLHLARNDAVEKLLLWIRGIRPRGVLGHAPVEGELVDVVQLGGLRLARPLAVGVDKGVGEDPEEPRLEIRAGSELLAEAERADIGFLHEVFCVRLRSRHPERRSVQRVDVGERLALERVLGHPVTLSERFRVIRHSR
jgi:hypothetical protein